MGGFGKPKQNGRRSRRNTVGRHRRGRPEAGKKVFGPREWALLAEFSLRRVSIREMAEHFGVAPSTISEHLERHVYPIHRQQMEERLGRAVAEVDLISKVAWERFFQSQKPRTKRELRRTITEATAGQASVTTITHLVRSINSTGEVAWLQVILRCLDWISRVGGYYGEHRCRESRDEGFRVAGKTLTQIDEEMLARLIEGIKRRKAYQEAMEAWQRGH